MKKKLVSAENISDFLDAEAKEIYVDSSMILTSGAKDYLRDKKVKLVYTKQVAALETPARSNAGMCQSEKLKMVVTKIVSILKNDFQISDSGTVERVTQRVLSGLKQG